ncbi:16S rRNA (cytosine(967)-C(5))-methyltransferase RsmB [Legionella jordanis]|uniref:16S rRNA (cytosine(967)-C(5))-methyltransferase RsmB n=1 Tax=Legionella jordanis TaxID=456 RepID=UPI000F0106DD|nr:16S rRNA (cytosine(967)-C(5))-methyltransferase RsmB [Legionella jordanis]RMX21412.1 16S rRNA (cytosine(967)-C(5))-methyltransferase RsmB [Legionella jordanis]
MKKNDRLEALRILKKLFEEKIPLSQLLQSANELSPFTKEICFGVLRHYVRLQTMADQLLDKKPKSLEVWLILLIGLYQLHYMQKPDYAVVKETVALLDRSKNSWAKALINAVLRKFCREHSTIQATLEQIPAFHFGHPQWLIDEIQKDWPNEWQHILTANDSHPPMSLRVNERSNSRDRYMQRLREAGIEAYPHEHSSVGIRLQKPCNVHELPGFEQGEVSVQDESAQQAAILLDLHPGLRLLDACCAPGGKTCHILEVEPQLKECLALDVDEKRLKRVQENLSRLHLSATLIKGDALVPDTWWDGQAFDRILLDAPCSATGVIRRHPDIKLLRSKEDILAISQLQADLLNSLWPLLAKGGLLVYATCSIMKIENEEQIQKFVLSHSDCSLVDSQAWGQKRPYGWQIFPAEKQGDGFFYSILRKH